MIVQSLKLLTSERKFHLLKWILLLLFLFLLGFAVVNPFSETNKNSQNIENEQNSGNGGENNSKLDIKIQKDKEMYQLGKHFNKHGRAMGYGSKSEYNEAAFKFAEANSKNANATIFEGTWNGAGKITTQTRQICISFENKSVILDKLSGQVIDFFEGTEMRGMINILKLQ